MRSASHDLSVATGRRRPRQSCFARRTRALDPLAGSLSLIPGHRVGGVAEQGDPALAPALERVAVVGVRAKGVRVVGAVHELLDRIGPAREPLEHGTLELAGDSSRRPARWWTRSSRPTAPRPGSRRSAARVPRITRIRPSTLGLEHPAARGVAGVARLRLSVELLAHDRLQPVGPDQDLPARGTPVGEVRGHPVVVLLEADELRASADPLPVGGVQQELVKRRPADAEVGLALQRASSCRGTCRCRSRSGRPRGASRPALRLRAGRDDGRRARRCSRAGDRSRPAPSATSCRPLEEQVVDPVVTQRDRGGEAGYAAPTIRTFVSRSGARARS